MEPWNKSLNFSFPTKYGIPKSWKSLAIGQVSFFKHFPPPPFSSFFVYPRCVHGIKSSGVPFGRVCWASVQSVAVWIVSLVVLLVVSTHLERYTHRIHGTGIFTYIYYIKNQPNVGKYTSPMDPIGYFLWNRRGNHFSISSGVIMLQKTKCMYYPLVFQSYQSWGSVWVWIATHLLPNDYLLTVATRSTPWTIKACTHSHSRAPWHGTLHNQPHIYTLYSGIGYIAISTLKRLLGIVKQLGHLHLKGRNHHFSNMTFPESTKTPPGGMPMPKTTASPQVRVIMVTKCGLGGDDSFRCV